MENGKNYNKNLLLLKSSFEEVYMLEGSEKIFH